MPQIPARDGLHLLAVGFTPRSAFDTSILNFYFADDSPEKKGITIRLIREVIDGKCEVYISPVLFKELNEAPERKRGLLLSLLNRFETTLLELTEET